ncbi:MAG: acylphosphatase [Acidimicrobiia bacterium]|nr:acylphosphatase [Acidimicrobiia bacterium]
MGMIARRLTIGGRVQGVGFRWSTRTEADAVGVTGWVRNRPDGTVEAWFQGEPEAVERMVDWAHRGPGSARVQDVEVTEADPDDTLSGFEIRR